MQARRVALTILLPVSVVFAACNAFDEPAGPLPSSEPTFGGVGAVTGATLGQAGGFGGVPDFGTAGVPTSAGAGGTGSSGFGSSGFGGASFGGAAGSAGAPVGGSGVVLPDASVPTDAGTGDDAGVDAGP